MQPPSGRSCPRARLSRAAQPARRTVRRRQDHLVVALARAVAKAGYRTYSTSAADFAARCRRAASKAAGPQLAFVRQPPCSSPTSSASRSSTAARPRCCDKRPKPPAPGVGQRASRWRGQREPQRGLLLDVLRTVPLAVPGHRQPARRPEGAARQRHRAGSRRPGQAVRRARRRPGGVERDEHRLAGAAQEPPESAEGTRPQPAAARHGRPRRARYDRAVGVGQQRRRVRCQRRPWPEGGADRGLGAGERGPVPTGLSGGDRPRRQRPRDRTGCAAGRGRLAVAAVLRHRLRRARGQERQRHQRCLRTGPRSDRLDLSRVGRSRRCRAGRQSQPGQSESGDDAGVGGANGCHPVALRSRWFCVSRVPRRRSSRTCGPAAIRTAGHSTISTPPTTTSAA